MSAPIAPLWFATSNHVLQANDWTVVNPPTLRAHMKHELVLKSGTIVDGTGAPSFVGDLAIDDGVITAIGPNLAGEREFDAAGPSSLLVGSIFTLISTDKRRGTTNSTLRSATA